MSAGDGAVDHLQAVQGVAAFVQGFEQQDAQEFLIGFLELLSK